MGDMHGFGSAGIHRASLRFCERHLASFKVPSNVALWYESSMDSWQGVKFIIFWFYNR
jgi:hypothetical protein